MTCRCQVGQSMDGDVVGIDYCPLHDGSQAEKFAEELRNAWRVIVDSEGQDAEYFRIHLAGVLKRIKKALADYESSTNPLT